MTDHPTTTDERTGATPAGSIGPVTSRLFRPGWPLSVLFLGFPLWWVTGLSAFVFIAVAVPMAVELLRRGHVRAPRGFGIWVLFLLWMLAGVTMLWADAPGSTTGGGFGRLLVFGYRAAMYLAATVVLLYVANLDEKELPTRRVIRLLAVMFGITTAGGVLGVVAPHFEFKSLMEYVLPGGLAGNDFINRMIHPAAANISTILGYEEARPIAPFAFANSWGANLSLYLPFFLLAWLGRDGGWRRKLAPLVLAASIVPIVYSLNRTLWLALGVGACYLAIRLAARGRLLAMQALGASLIVAVLVVVLSPLSTILLERLENPHSNDRRIQLAIETFQSVATGSPLLGYGSTRDVEGSFASIAGGATPDCPACDVPPFGTQGQLWLVVFATGFVGLVLFLTFFGRRLVAHWRDPSPLATACCCVLLFFFIELPFYDTLGAPMFTVMIAIGLLFRSANATAGREEHDG